MKLIRDVQAGLLMFSSLRFFYAEKEFRGKRIAIIGAADSAFEEKKGEFIDGHDIVIRINRAPYSWSAEKAEYIGSKFTYLYHSFFENNYSGGGPIDWEYFDRIGIKKVINPISSGKGLVTHLNYYRRQHSTRRTYILTRPTYKEITKSLQSYIPTVGFSALMSVLESDFQELYITGFTFFQTPYADNYRDHLQNKKDNQRHIGKQGLHNPELEFKIFRKKISSVSDIKKIRYDPELRRIIAGKKSTT